MPNLMQMTKDYAEKVWCPQMQQSEFYERIQDYDGKVHNDMCCIHIQCAWWQVDPTDKRYGHCGRIHEYTIGKT